jgi:hypothetical protein
MSKMITFSEAVTRFDKIVTTGITIEEAIQEAVDRIYEFGRYPGTTEEIELLEADFTLSSDGLRYTYEYAEGDYAGAIGFRCDSGGWGIVDQVALYKDGLNAGDREFVDLGTIDLGDGNFVRRYRCPLGWQPDQGPFYALMKKEAPILEHDDIIPIQGVAALKCAIQAVCYETVGDEQRSQLKWTEFNQFMSMGTRQVAGPKKFHIGLDCSLKRKPKQFM